MLDVAEVYGTVAAGELPNFKISKAGDIIFLTDAFGPILTDRTTATKYRLYVDNGVLSIEAV